jgi:tripartite-type tricarboxylate transporter receptor subunit TctC
VTAQRQPQTPEVPTFKEQGVDLVYDAWFGLMVPAGVPKNIIEKINKDVVAILNDPAVKAKFAAQSLVSDTDTPAQFDKIIRDNTAVMTEIFKTITN